MMVMMQDVGGRMESGDRELVNGGNSTQRKENCLWLGRRSQEPHLSFTLDVENKSFSREWNHFFSSHEFDNENIKADWTNLLIYQNPHHHHICNHNCSNVRYTQPKADQCLNRQNISDSIHLLKLPCAIVALDLVILFSDTVCKCDFKKLLFQESK